MSRKRLRRKMMCSVPAHRDSRDSSGQVPDSLTRHSAVEPGRTGTRPFRAGPAVPPCDAPKRGITSTLSSGSFPGRARCGGAEPLDFNLCSKIGMAPWDAARAAMVPQLPFRRSTGFRIAHNASKIPLAGGVMKLPGYWRCDPRDTSKIPLAGGSDNFSDGGSDDRR